MHTAITQAQNKVSTTWGVSAPLGEHGMLLSIVLHLLPGIVTGAVYLALRTPVVAAGYPVHVALVMAIPLAMIPVELGMLLYLGHQRNGRLSLRGVVLYRERIALWRYLMFVPLVFVASLVVIAVGGIALDNPLRTMVFGWMPSLDWELGGYTRAVLVVSFALTALFVTLGESTVEELYFRGFLLPRMGYAGRWATPLHCLLFALYHVWQPWRLVSVAVGMLPIVFAVRRTKNIYLGMIAHMLLNSWDVIVGVGFILAMTSGWHVTQVADLWLSVAGLVVLFGVALARTRARRARTVP